MKTHKNVELLNLIFYKRKTILELENNDRSSL